MRNLRITLTLFALTLLNGSVFSQNFYKEKVSRDKIISIGLGPSFAYLDNGGQYRQSKFAVKPALSFGFTKKLTQIMNIRATAGIQWIRSGGSPNATVQDYWTQHNSAFSAKGQAYFFDIMPTFYLIPFGNHMYRSKVNLYAGLGIGVMHSVTDQTMSFNPEEVPERTSISTGYVPFRAGLSLKTGAYSNIALEGTQLWTFTDNLDGNVGFNKFGDHLFQTQLVFRRYIVPKKKD